MNRLIIAAVAACALGGTALAQNYPPPPVYNCRPPIVGTGMCAIRFAQGYMQGC